MLHGLKKSVIDDIQNVFAKYPLIDKVLLYGSRAKGNYKNGSDIDLTIFSDEMDLKQLHKIEEDLDDLLLPYKIDLSIYNHIDNDNLKDHIKRVGIELFRNSEDAL